MIDNTQVKIEKQKGQTKRKMKILNIRSGSLIAPPSFRKAFAIYGIDQNYMDLREKLQ